MASIKINSDDFDLNEVLSGISKLNIDELKQVMSQISTFIARKKAPHFSKEEAQLIEKINDGISEKNEKKYQELRLKILEENINQEEHQELIQLIKISEKKANERLKYIIELALLWDTTTDDVMKRLDLKPPPPIHV